MRIFSVSTFPDQSGSSPKIFKSLPVQPTQCFQRFQDHYELLKENLRDAHSASLGKFHWGGGGI